MFHSCMFHVLSVDVALVIGHILYRYTFSEILTLAGRYEDMKDNKMGKHEGSQSNKQTGGQTGKLGGRQGGDNEERQAGRQAGRQRGR